MIDVHAHFFPSSLTALADRQPVLEIDSAGDTGRIMRGDEIFREVRAPLWDVPARLAELDAAGIALQVVSPVPVTLLPGASPHADTAYLSTQNDLLSEAVSGSEAGGRLSAFGGVPLHDPETAAAEAERLASLPGMAGVEIGTRAGARELDDRALDPFFAAAEQHDLPVFIHPTHGATATRRGEHAYAFGLGMLTDTALAAAALVFGGVLDRFPRLRVALAHGCGSMPWAYPRLRYAHHASDGDVAARYDALLRRLWCDTLVFDPAHVPLLIERFGADHLLVGTDHPFYPTPLAELAAFPQTAHAAGRLTRDQADAIRDANPARFLGDRLDKLRQRTPTA